MSDFEPIQVGDAQPVGTHRHRNDALVTQCHQPSENTVGQLRFQGRAGLKSSLSQKEKL